MITVQCLNYEGELVVDRKFDNIICMRIFTEGEMVTQLARKNIKTVLIDMGEEK